MPQRKMRKLVTATIAVGLIAGSALGSPLAFARSRTGSGPIRSAAGPGSGPGSARARGTDRPRRRDSAGTSASGRPARAAAPGGSAGRAAAARPADPLAVPPPPPADPLAPPAPPNPFAPPAQPTTIPEGTPAGQNPTPYTGEPVFLPPSFNPVNGSMVGVGKPIIINFQRPIVDRPMAEQAIHISSYPPVPGKFYWMSNTQVRWRPIELLAARTRPSTSMRAAPSRASAPVSRWSPPSTTRRTR